ncbi:MAG: prolipoprotein diacylglyceryl transferase [Myxococcota bacterium]
MYPVLFEIHGFQLSSFGVMMAIAFLVGGWLLARCFESAGHAADDAWRLVTWAMLGGVLGAKLWYVGEALARDPASRQTLFQLGGPLLSRGGITWYGGLVGGALGVSIKTLRMRLSLSTVTEASAPALAIGQAIGRIGCFLVGDDYGRVTQSWVGVAFPRGLPPAPEPVHPTQLYEVAWLGLAAAWLWSRRGRSPSLFGEYLMIAGAGRFWIEIFRTNPPWLGPLSNAQVTAALCFGLGSILWLRGLRPRAAIRSD